MVEGFKIALLSADDIDEEDGAMSRYCVVKIRNTRIAIAK